jgi:hypothetical protein
MKTLNDSTCILNWIQIHWLELKFNSIQQLNSYSNEKNEIQIGGESTENFVEEKKKL